jgi:hypothetical protein
VRLADGSAILVTCSIGEAEMQAMTLAEALAAKNADREDAGAIPFFREGLKQEIQGLPTYEAARAALGDRAQLLLLRTTEEWIDDQRAASEAWLRRDD